MEDTRRIVQRRSAISAPDPFSSLYIEEHNLVLILPGNDLDRYLDADGPAAQFAPQFSAVIRLRSPVSCERTALCNGKALVYFVDNRLNVRAATPSMCARPSLGPSGGLIWDRWSAQGHRARLPIFQVILQMRLPMATPAPTES